jgi:hypothetical protein
VADLTLALPRGAASHTGSRWNSHAPRRESYLQHRGCERPQPPTVRAFADELRDVMLGDGWRVDPTSSGSATGSPAILGAYSQPVAAGYEATVEFMLESLPVVSLGRAPSGVSAGLSVGGEIGIRHLPTQQLLMELGEAADAGSVTRDLEEIYDDNDQALPTIASPSEAALVARQLACTAAGEALTFARGHADIDALLSYIRSDGISTRLLVFEATLVPSLLATAGRVSDARAAITHYRSRLAGPEAGGYEQIAGRLLARLG